MTILIVAPEDDLHAQVVTERLRSRGRHVETLNTTWFPWRTRLTWSSNDVGIRASGLSNIDLDQVTSVWWRRFRKPTPDPSITDPHVRRFCVSEATQALRGMFSSLACNIINDPDAERRASLKLVQLDLAKKIGLRIPATIVSNSRAEILEFLARHEVAICKTIVCDYPHSVPTRQCIPADFASEDCVALSPIIVQEQVNATLDIRVTVVGRAVFAAELRRPDTNENVDWRMTPSGWARHNLPDDVQSKLLQLLGCLGLATASVDLRLSADAGYVFLEVNPSGQFLFLEVDAGLPISDAFATLLTSAEGPAPRTQLSNPMVCSSPHESPADVVS